MQFTISRTFNDIIVIILVCLFAESIRTYEPDLADDQSTEGSYNILTL